MLTTLLLVAALVTASGAESQAKLPRAKYLDLIEAAVMAYSDAHMESYVRDVEREGVQEHGFPRLAANLGLLVANGRCTGKRDLLKRMLDASCRDAAKGKMPPKSGGNEFSVKELVEAVVALENAKAYSKDVTDAWRADLSRVTLKSYSSSSRAVGLPSAGNWLVFACASEQTRLAHGMGGDPAFVERYVADQLRWFDANGMYKDPNQPSVYDFVTRLQFAIILRNGYDGPSRAKLEAQMEASAEPTLKMLSAAGEIPYGGRSNQFLHNNTFYAALCEWYAARDAKRGDRVRAARFRAAAAEAVAALDPWLAEHPLSHVKNRYPREEGKGVYSAKGDMGCERYAYFDKYMVTMGSWAALGWLFADESVAVSVPPRPVAEVFMTTPEFHFAFLRAGDYSAQFDYLSDEHYDSEGLGRLQRAGAPSTLCLAAPCAKHPNYRIPAPNDAPLAILPVQPDGCVLVPRLMCAEGETAHAIWDIRGADKSKAWICDLGPDGLTSKQTGLGELALTLPAFSFDGRERTEIAAADKSLTITYRGWRCIYETNGTIVDTGRSAANRNGTYRRFEAHGVAPLVVKIRLEK